MSVLSKLGDRLTQYALLMRIDKPVGTFLLLWPTLWALWFAGEGNPEPFVVFVFVCGVVVMRSAGCVINDFADREIDPHVRRTMNRPLAAGRTSARETLLLFAGLGAIALALVLTQNGLTIGLAGVGAALAASYPFMKRWTYLPQVHLGLAFGWGVPMSFAAQTGAVAPVAWLIWIGVIVWAVAYDTMYAMVDREDDLYVGVKSTAILFGDADRAFVGVSQASVLVVLWLAGSQLEMGIPFALSVGAAAALFVYQQWLIRDREPAACFKAFLNNNWVGAAIFAGIVLDYAVR